MKTGQEMRGIVQGGTWHCGAGNTSHRRWPAVRGLTYRIRLLTNGFCITEGLFASFPSGERGVVDIVGTEHAGLGRDTVEATGGLSCGIAVGGGDRTPAVAARSGRIVRGRLANPALATRWVRDDSDSGRPTEGGKVAGVNSSTRSGSIRI